MLPYSLGSSIASIPAARFISYMQNKSGTTIGQKLVVITGLAISAIGFGTYSSSSIASLLTFSESSVGVLIVLDNRSSTAVQEIAPLFAGIGIGMLFHAPFQVLTMALEPNDIASATSAFFLVRFNGATCGLVSELPSLTWGCRLTELLNVLASVQAVAGAVFNGRLLSSGSVGVQLSSATSSSIDLRALAQMQPIELREEMLRIVTSAIQVSLVFVICVNFSSLTLIYCRRYGLYAHHALVLHSW